MLLMIVLVLTVLYWRNSSGTHEKAGCERNLQTMYLALQVYANDSRGKFPEVDGATNSETPLSLLVPHYTIDTSAFICPNSKDAPLPPSEPFPNRKISYAYYMGRSTEAPQEILMSDRQVNTNSKAGGELVFSENGLPPGNNHRNGGNFLQADGTTEFSPPHAGFSLTFTQGIVLLNP